MTTKIEMKEKSNFANVAEKSALDCADKSEDNSSAIAVVAKKTPKLDEQPGGEIKMRWIPYAVSLRASLVENKMGREELIAELRKLDPENAETIVKNAERLSVESYEELARNRQYGQQRVG